MRSAPTPKQPPAPCAATRRRVVAGGTAAAAAALLWPAAVRAQAAAAAAPAVATAADVQHAIATFARGAQPKDEGLLLDAPDIADNPSAVAVRASVTRPIDERRWCEEMIFVTELNPTAVACTLRFTPAAGTAEAGVRIRLAQSQTVRVLARMSDGEVLQAAQAITISTSGCGM